MLRARTLPGWFWFSIYQLENVKIVLELLRDDSWIIVDCEQPGVIGKGSDGGVIGSGQVGGKDQVDQGSYGTSLQDTR